MVCQKQGTGGTQCAGQEPPLGGCEMFASVGEGIAFQQHGDESAPDRQYQVGDPNENIRFERRPALGWWQFDLRIPDSGSVQSPATGRCYGKQDWDQHVLHECSWNQMILKTCGLARRSGMACPDRKRAAAGPQ